MDLEDFLQFLGDKVFRFFEDYMAIRDERDRLQTDVALLQSDIQRMKSERNLYPYQLEDKDKEIRRLVAEVTEHENRREELWNVCLKVIDGLPEQLILYTVRDRPTHAWSVGNDGFPEHARILAQNNDVEEVAYYVRREWKEVDDEGRRSGAE